jgi:uncharacterized repeat protein (TIGR01451 family)
MHSHYATSSSTIPPWFRYGVVAVAVLVLCSCRSTAPQNRGAERAILPSTAADAPKARFQSPDAAPAVLPAAMSGCPYGGCPGAPCLDSGCTVCGQDGLRGPRDEYLCDGGDLGAQAMMVRSGAIKGLDPEDAIAHYDTIDGRTIVTPSNKVCIYAPRFAAVRQVIDLRAFVDVDAAAGAHRPQGPMLSADKKRATPVLAEIEPNIHRVKEPPSLLRNRQQPGELERNRRVAQTLGSVAAYANLQTIRTGEVVGRDIVKLARASLAAIAWSGDQAAQVLIDNRQAITDVGVQTPGTIYLLVEPNNPKLRLIKLASTETAQPGDEVEFTLRFDNVGDRVIGNVTILDSLTTRLEYVEGSQKCSLDAEFEARDNDASSLKLRWQIAEPLPKGQGGVIQFRCRVR